MSRRYPHALTTGASTTPEAPHVHAELRNPPRRVERTCSYDSIVTTCVRCNYDLRLLAPGGSCPECGTPIALTKRHGDLLQSDGAWLRTTRNGVIAVMAGCVGLWLSFALAMSQTLDPIAPPPGASLFFAALFAATAFMLAGFWLSTPEPDGAAPPRSTRRVAGLRLAKMLIPIMIIASVAPASFFDWGSAMSPAPRWDRVAADVAFAACGAVYVIFLVARLQDLDARVPLSWYRRQRREKSRRRRRREEQSSSSPPPWYHRPMFPRIGRRLHWRYWRAAIRLRKAVPTARRWLVNFMRTASLVATIAAGVVIAILPTCLGPWRLSMPVGAMMWLIAIGMFSLLIVLSEVFGRAVNLVAVLWRR